MVAAIRDDVGTVPLAQLPGLAADQPGPLQEALDNLRRRLLKVGLGLVKALTGQQAGEALGAVGAVLLGVAVLALLISFFNWAGRSSFNFNGLIVPLVIVAVRVLARLKADGAGSTRRPPKPRPARPGSGRPGLFQRLESWLGGRIDNLEQKRQNEIERLLKLFGENLEEALKYAIPLGGPYQDRGAAPPSARLGARATDFNLRGLGGGGRADVWNLDAYRDNLGLQYRQAATREIEAGRFKKAAYIYAHLLADFHSAALTLEQGGFYREAAALYQDHLNNRLAAAKCLENGGLLIASRRPLRQTAGARKSRRPAPVPRPARHGRPPLRARRDPTARQRRLPRRRPPAGPQARRLRAGRRRCCYAAGPAPNSPKCASTSISTCWPPPPMPT